MNPGTIIRLYLEDIGKIKWFVILKRDSTCKSALTALINSQINPKINRSDTRVTLHLPLRKAEYPILDHDSYLDCSTVYDVDLNIIAMQILDSRDAIKGNLLIEHHELAIRMVQKSSHVERKLLKKYKLSSVEE